MDINNEGKSNTGSRTGGVQSLHRAMSILRAVAQSRGGITLAEISKNIGLHNSTAFHLARTMVDLGLLRQDEDNKRYRIGPQLFSLASGAKDEIELLRTASPTLAELAMVTGENSHVAVWAGHEAVLIAKSDGTSSVRLNERVGMTRPAYATAVGKILLSDFSIEDLEVYLGSVEFKPITSNTIQQPHLLRAAVLEARSTGVAFDDGEFDLEVRCIAAPVRDFSGRIVAAIGISAPLWRLNLNQLESLTEIVKSHASKLSYNLGFVEMLSNPGDINLDHH